MKKYEIVNMVEFYDLDPDMQAELEERLVERAMLDLADLTPEDFTGAFGEPAGRAAERAAEEAERLRTPWFYPSILWEQEEIKDLVEEIVKEEFDSHLYSVDGQDKLNKKYVREVE